MHPDPQPAARVLERYRLVHELGRGGAGIVYAATDERLGRTVAVKLLRGRPQVPQAAARMAREAQALADVQHRHLVTLLDYGVEGGAPCLVMSCVDGVDLKRLSRRQPLTVPETVAVLDQTLDALSACHARGYVHRDLKPGNVLVERSDGPLSVKLIDFGIVQLAGDAGATALTVAGEIFGSLRYMAPEQFAQVAVGPPTDLYAVGLIGYWLLAGGRHFIPPGPPHAIYLRHLDLAARPTPSHSAAGDAVPPGLLAVLARACAPRPTERFPDAAAMRAALAPWVSDRVPTPPGVFHALDDAPTAPVPRGAHELQAALVEAAALLSSEAGPAAHGVTTQTLLAATVVDDRPSQDARPLGQQLSAALQARTPVGEVARVAHRPPATGPDPAATVPTGAPAAPTDPTPPATGSGVPWWLLLLAAAGFGALAGLIFTRM